MTNRTKYILIFDMTGLYACPRDNHFDAITALNALGNAICLGNPKPELPQWLLKINPETFAFENPSFS